MSNIADNPYSVSFTPTASPVAQERTNFGNLNSGYMDMVGKQPSAVALQDKYANKFNIPDLTQKAQFQGEQANMVGDQIKAIPASVASASQNSMLTQGQADRVAQSQETPLLNSYNKLASVAGQTQQNLGQAQSNQNSAVNAEQADQLKQTNAYLKQYDTENILSTMAMTGWSTENAQQLQTLLANQAAGVQLSEGDKNRANALAVAETNFENQLKLNADTRKNTPAPAPNTQVISQGGKQYLIDSATGKIISTYGTGTASYKPTFGTTGSSTSGW